MKKFGNIWFDGKLIDESEANISVMTHGLHYASSVFEGIRSYNQNVFMLNEHTKRLFKSAEMLDMKIPFSISEIENACIEVIKSNNLNNAYIRPFVWRGSETIKISAKDNKIHIAIAAWEAGEKYKKPLNFNNGQVIKIGNFRRAGENCLPVQSKCAGNYTIATIEKHQAEREGFNDALLLDYRGFIAETTSANIFFVNKNELITPIADCFLNGLTRQTVIKLAKKLSINVIEKHIEENEYKNMDDCFITSTTLEIMPINKILDKSFERNDLTIKLMKEFANFSGAKYE